jgi:hypothetical protein
VEAAGYKRREVAADIDSPCADLLYSYIGANVVSVTMLLSRVVDRPSQDLVLWFRGVIVFSVETDRSVLLELPTSLPKCSNERWGSSIFPLTIVEHSQWLRPHASRKPVEVDGRRHFVLVTMNAICEVLALPNVIAA